MSTEHRNGKALPEGLAAIFSAVVLTRGNMPKVLLEPQFGPIQANSSFLALLFIKQDPAPRMRRKSRVGIRLIHDASVPLCLDNGNPTGCVSSLTDGRQNFSVLGCLVFDHSTATHYSLIAHLMSVNAIPSALTFLLCGLSLVLCLDHSYFINFSTYSTCMRTQSILKMSAFALFTASCAR
jgi:hypothetical protein